MGFATDGNMDGWPDDVETTIRRPISVAALLEREGFEPTRRRAARRALSGVAAGAVLSLGAVVGSLFLGHGRTTAGDTLAAGGFVKSGGDIVLAESSPHTSQVTPHARQSATLPHRATTPRAHPAGQAPATDTAPTVRQPVPPPHQSHRSAATGGGGNSPVAGAASRTPATTPSDTGSAQPSTQSAPASTQSATSAPATSSATSTTDTPASTTTPPTSTTPPTTTTTSPSTSPSQPGLLGGVAGVLGDVTQPVFDWFG